MNITRECVVAKVVDEPFLSKRAKLFVQNPGSRDER
jgi:hypothetical protein